MPEAPARSAFTRRLVVFASLAVGTAVAALGFVAARSLWFAEDDASLSVVQEVEDDVAAEVDVVWGRFAATFPARMDCIDDVIVQLVRWVDEGDGRYVAGQGRIEIRVPIEPDRFRDELARELARHLEYSCDEIAELRDVFGSSMDDERWTSAVIELVNDRPVAGNDAATLEVIAAWGRGETPG